MSSTVTTTTVTTIAAIGGAMTFALIAIFALMAFLAAREVAGAGRTVQFKMFTKGMNIAVVPLLMSFVIIIGMKIADVLTS